MKKFNFLLLILITFLAAILRFYHLQTTPPSLYWDEVSIGYNAYSILQTGKDEWGVPFPLTFKSFGDYKLPLYIYSVAGLEKFLGPTELAVRLPAALAGIITVVAFYFLANELRLLIYSHESKTKFFQNASLPLLASLFLAVSPWHWQFTRAGFEASFGLLFLTASVLFFLLAMRKNINFLFISVFLSVASFFSYHSAAIVSAALIFIVFLLYFRQIKNFRVLILAIVLGAVILLPYLPRYYSGATGRIAFTGISVTNQKGELLKNFTDNYLANFSFDYLFFKGDQEGRHSVKKLGELYLWQLPAVLLGVYFLLRHRSKVSIVIFAWLLIAAIPVALTRVSPHALRNLMAVVPWQIISIVGLVYFFGRTGKIWRVLLLPIFLFAFATYIHQYLVHYPVSYAGDWQDGQKQAVTYLKKVEKNYSEIFLTSGLYPIYLEFFLPYDPRKLQQAAHNELQLGKFKYVDLNRNPLKTFPEKTSLIIAPSWMGSDIFNARDPIKMTYGDNAFRVYEY